jgi:hypothetical protein
VTRVTSRCHPTRPWPSAAPELGDQAGWYFDGLAALAHDPHPALPTVAQLTGRPAMTYGEWARGHADLFR